MMRSRVNSKVIRIGLKKRDRESVSRKILHRDLNMRYNKGIDEPFRGPAAQLEQIQSSLNEINESFRQISVGKEGESMSEERLNRIEKKVGEISEKVSAIDERTKRLDQLPTKDEIRGIFSETIKTHDLASENFVENKVNGAKWQMACWIVGTGIAASAVIIGIL